MKKGLILKEFDPNGMLESAACVYLADIYNKLYDLYKPPWLRLLT